MDKLLEQAKQLVSDLKAKGVSLDKELAACKEATAKLSDRKKECSEKESELSSRESAVADVEYSLEIVEKNNNLLKANTATKEELKGLVEDLANQRKEFFARKRDDENAIEEERKSQKKNSMAIIQREKEVKEKMAEYEARILAVSRR